MSTYTQTLNNHSLCFVHVSILISSAASSGLYSVTGVFENSSFVFLPFNWLVHQTIVTIQIELLLTMSITRSCHMSRGLPVPLKVTLKDALQSNLNSHQLMQLPLTPASNTVSRYYRSLFPQVVINIIDHSRLDFYWVYSHSVFYLIIFNVLYLGVQSMVASDPWKTIVRWIYWDHR